MTNHSISNLQLAGPPIITTKVGRLVNVNVNLTFYKDFSKLRIVFNKKVVKINYIA
jgi:hypothetical protein